MRKSLSAIAFAVVLGIGGTAFASECPKHMKAIDDALAKMPQLTAAQMADVKKARADGEAQHKAGKHADSMTALKKGEAILGIK